MFDFLYVIIGWIMKMCYSISFNNYILTLFIFAVVMQIILFPFGIKQQKATVKQASLKPKEMAIKEKYRGRNDRVTQQKMQTEIQEMYKAEGYSPTAGCLPLLVQMPIILALFGVVKMPLSYTTSLDNTSEGKGGYNVKSFFVEAYTIAENQIDAYEEKLLFCEDSEKQYCKDRIAELEKIQKEIIDDNYASTFTELELIKFMQSGIDTFMKDFNYKDGVYQISGSADITDQLGADISYSDLNGASFKDKLLYKQNALTTTGTDIVYDFNEMLKDKGLYNEEQQKKNQNAGHSLPNFDFIGNTTTLDFPSFSFNWLLLIPVLVFLSSFFSSEIIKKLNGRTNDPNNPNPADSGLMRWMMPLMSTWFAFQFPAAIGLYWTFRSITSIGQQFALSKLYPVPHFTDEEIKKAVGEVKQAKKRKKVVTIEVDEDDTTYDELAISEERAEKIRRRREKAMAEEKGAPAEEKGTLVEKPTLKDDSDRKE